MSVDTKRKRIALSMRLDDSAAEHEANDGKKLRRENPEAGRSSGEKPRRTTARKPARTDAGPQAPNESAFAMAFARAKVKK